MKKQTILIVEDDAILALHLQDILSRLEFKVAKPLASGEEAIDFLSRNHVDLILMDIELAGRLNGIDAAEQIHQSSDVPVVFLSGFSHDPLLGQAKIAAPYGYLVKPVPERELAATLEMALHRHSLDQKLTESRIALQKSEAKYRHLFEHSPLGIFRTTMDGRVLAVNAEMAKLFGCETPEEAVRDFTDLEHQLYVDPDRRREFISRLEKNGEVNHFEFQARKKSGELIWISMNAKLVPADRDNDPFAGMVIDCFAMDITARKQAENQIQRNEVRLKGIVDILQYRAETVQDFLDKALEEAIRLTESAIGYIYFYDEVQREFVLNTWSKEVMKECRIVNPQTCYALDKTGIWGEAVRQRRPIILNDFKNDHPLRKGYPKGHAPLTRFMTIPIFKENSIVAVAGVANKASDYDEADVLQLTLLMDAVWKSVDIKKGEEALQKSEEIHRNLVQSLPDVVMRFDRAGRHLFVSENVCEAIDMGADQFVGRTHRELGFPEDKCRSWEEAVQGVFESGELFDGENCFIGKKGRPVIHNWRLVPEFDGQGRVTSVLSLSRDITAHRMAEQNYQALFREMLNGFAVHEIICNDDCIPVDYRFLAVNPAFERMTGLQASDIVGRTVTDVLPGIESHWIETYGKVAITGEPVTFENVSGELNKYFEVTAYRPAPNQFACIFSDITERKRSEKEKILLQAQLSQAQKMEAIGTLAGGIAHDFNNILGVILGYSEMAREDSLPGSIAAEDLDQVIKAGNRAKELVKQILAFSRQTKAEQIPLQPAAIVKESIKLLRSSLPATIIFQQNIDPDTHSIVADPTQIHQVLMNLCTNAYHAMEQTGGLLSISLKDKYFSSSDLNGYPDIHPGNYIHLSVSDTGPGITPEIRERIFDPYFTTKEVGKGTGMGLAIVHGIVKSYGGFVVCRSGAGEGTVFEVNLPAMDEKVMPETQQPLVTVPVGNECILFIDDEKTLAEMARNMLERLGYTVTVCLSSFEALAAFRNQPDAFDLVITDQTMPGMTGLDLSRRMLQLRPDLPIILCTGYSSQVSEAKARSAGISGFALKPLAKADIAALIRRVLGKHSGEG